MGLHILFFWIRVVISMCIISSYRNPPLYPCILAAMKDDTIYIHQFNTFLLYFVLHSLSQENVLGYSLSIITMVHNAGLSLLITLINRKFLPEKDLICAGLFSASYILEAIHAVCISYLRRHEINFEFFKNVGVDPKINESYVTRKRLQTFGMIDIFVSTAVLGKIILPPHTKYSAVSFVTITIVLLTYVRNVLMSANIDDENTLQRNVAIWMSFANILLLMMTIVLTALYASGCVASTHGVQLFVYADMLVVKIVMNIYMRKDKKNFGSGLKEFFAFRGQVLDLSK